MKKFLDKYNQFNEFVAVKLTFSVGSMTCAWAFLIWSLIPLMFPSSQVIVAYVSSDILQLVLLSVIMVGQDIGGRKAEQRAQQDHETLMAEFAELKEIHTAELEEIAELKEIINLLKTKKEES